MYNNLIKALIDVVKNHTIERRNVVFEICNKPIYKFNRDNPDLQKAYLPNDVGGIILEFCGDNTESYIYNQRIKNLK